MTCSRQVGTMNRASPSGSDYRCFFTKFTVDTLDHSIQTGSISVDHTALHAVDGVGSDQAAGFFHTDTRAAVKCGWSESVETRIPGRIMPPI